MIAELHLIVESGDTPSIIADATARANEWLAQQRGLLNISVTPQTIHQQTIHHSGGMRDWYMHIITISFQRPTFANLAAMMAATL